MPICDFLGSTTWISLAQILRMPISPRFSGRMYTALSRGCCKDTLPGLTQSPTHQTARFLHLAAQTPQSASGIPNIRKSLLFSLLTSNKFGQFPFRRMEKSWLQLAPTPRSRFGAQAASRKWLAWAAILVLSDRSNTFLMEPTWFLGATIRQWEFGTLPHTNLLYSMVIQKKWGASRCPPTDLRLLLEAQTFASYFGLACLANSRWSGQLTRELFGKSSSVKTEKGSHHAAETRQSRFGVPA